MTKAEAAGGDERLADLFELAQGHGRKAPSCELLARVLADAEDTQARAQATIRERQEAPPGVAPLRGGGWRGLWAAIGGWPGLGGLTVAALVGVWIGSSQPATLDDLAGSYLGFAATSLDYGDLLPGIQDMLTEG